MSTWHVVICGDCVRTGFYIASYTGPTVSFIIYRPSCDELVREYPLDRACFEGCSIDPHGTRVYYMNNHQSGDGIEIKSLVVHLTRSLFRKI